MQSYCDGAVKDGVTPSLLSMLSDDTVAPGEWCTVQVRTADCPTATVLFGATTSMADGWVRHSVVVGGSE